MLFPAPAYSTPAGGATIASLLDEATSRGATGGRGGKRFFPLPPPIRRPLVALPSHRCLMKRRLAVRPPCLIALSGIRKCAARYSAERFGGTMTPFTDHHGDRHGRDRAG